MQRKELRPGVYPTVYRCITCGCEVKKKEFWTTKAKQLDETRCVCERCLAQKPDQQTNPPGTLATQSGSHDSIAGACAALWQEWRNRRNQKKERIDAKENLATFLDASLGDPAMRAQLLAIVRLDDFQRETMLDPIIVRLQKEKAPLELLQFMTSLKESSVAKCARDILESK